MTGTMPWERQEGESARAFAAFQGYRDQPTRDRSLRRLATALNRSRKLVGELSSKWRWVERAMAWDAEQDRLLQQTIGEERKAFAKRLAASGALMQAKGLTKVRSYIDRYDRDGNETRAEQLRSGQQFTDTIPLLEAARLIEVGARLEARGRGLPSPDDEATHATAIHINPIVAALTTNPSKTGVAIEQMEKLVLLLSTSEGPEIPEPDDTP